MSKIRETIEQLADLRASQSLFIKENEIFEKDIEALDFAIEELKKIEEKEIKKQYQKDCYVRHCNECGKEMWQGYCIDNGMEYYCCEDCLNKNITEEEWADLYASGDSYYTDWFEEQKEYKKIEEELEVI